MLRVNKKVEYAIIALIYLGSKEEKTASVREMSTHCHVPETLLSKIMQTMKNVGLVSAVYGNQGGYRLNRSLDDVNLLDLTQTISGPIHVAECLNPENHDCPVRPSCSIIAPMGVLNQKLIELFESTSLQALTPPPDLNTTAPRISVRTQELAAV